jgi:hypothetical protein
MAELFAEYNQFKSIVGGRINQSVELASLDPFIYEAARKHIVPWLGSVYATLVADGSPTPAQTALITYVRRPLALLTIHEYSKVVSVELSDSGMHRIETETRKSSYRYQEKQFQEDALQKGYDALENMLFFLDSNRATYPDWVATEEATAHLSQLLNYNKDFRRLVNTNCDRYSFEALRPIIAHQQLMICQSAVPSAFWAGFMSRHIAGTLTSAEKTVREYMRQAIAYAALNEAMKLHYVTISMGRIFIQEEFGEQSNINRTMPNAGSSDLAINQIMADRYTVLWKDYSFPTVFDVASGGSNSNSDAWHINNADEADAAAYELDLKKKKGVLQL